MITDKTTLWIVILLLGLGTFFIRFSFLGLIGSREMPGWILRHLRYVAVAVMPGLIAPLVLWPPANDGNTEPTRLIAAMVAFAIGMWTKRVIGAVAGGMGALYAAQYLIN